MSATSWKKKDEEHTMSGPYDYWSCYELIKEDIFDMINKYCLRAVNPQGGVTVSWWAIAAGFVIFFLVIGWRTEHKARKELER